MLECGVDLKDPLGFRPEKRETMNIVFAPAERSDIGTLLDLMARYYAYDHIPFDRAAARPALEQLLSDHSLGRAWVIRAGTEAAGYFVLTLCFGLEFRGRTAFIDELFVHEAFRGRGIGTRALAFLKDAARDLGVTALRLEVERKNVDQQRLYRKAGFEDQDRDLMTVRLSVKEHLA